MTAAPGSGGRRVQIGDATLILGRCEDHIGSLQDIGTVISDPPYGISFKWTGVDRTTRKGGLTWGAGGQRNGIRQPLWQDIIGDQQTFDPLPWLRFPQVILWGGNNYPAMPAARCWLVWDKRRDTTPDCHGDAELAWTNLDSVIGIHRQVWRGIVREGEENVVNEAKHHPTQKPVALMSWCVGMTRGTIVDPYMGSGTTGVAAIRAGRPFIGIECDEAHFATAVRRIEAASRQADLFHGAYSAPAAARPVQPDLLAAAAEPSP